MMELTMAEVNSGWPCVVRIWIGGVGGGGCAGFVVVVVVGEGDGGANRTMPWFGERLVDPRRWKDGGTDGTWSRCICWIVWGLRLAWEESHEEGGKNKKRK
jgi:hypothetical protein